MLIKFDDGTPISLEQMLLAKEKRVVNQQSVLTLYQHPIISLSLVIPGAIKNSSGAKYLFNEAIKALHKCFLKNNITIIDEKHYCDITGYEAIFSINYCAEKLKQYCINIENSHPLGRLWDIDVIDPVTKKSLSRVLFANQPRQCLVCDDIAKVCGRAKRHSINEVFIAIEKKIQNFQQS
ncbi:holo-ACP synthase CitX [Gilliamella sp. Choc4-2]|uniref:citrate lyase holo-[acyl-carrier protein] synthase n=1 Tax=unclassified Gilliamella TaxID=2685620 RepID=UPI0004DD6CA1|nr:citrate lyase holo-[acyl-carrier protein] synthase [Gilliamella apicola]KFA58688.1 CitG protein [Gilliamella apicola]OCG33006.1 holo-ACP synthase CitX [Gilliamella apicola]OCG43158.1 holo-ACP synthase CitX [Gilliamella apicola]OCG53360.1 holo-ACP synthase CitX [Gilliamella apicola]OCG65056.1 holo-ACP synthase CitX [Gilliamella apicola]